ncbi:hypothetical protein EGW08_023604, partial [Elysia chlorotica]
MVSGFALLQMAIENVLMKSMGLKNPDPAIRNPGIQLMPLREYSAHTVLSTQSLTLVFSFAMMFTSLAVNIVAEKEKKIKEGMMMMGLRSSVFWLSWTLVYMVLISIASCLIITIIVVSDFISQSNIFLLFLAFLLYGGSFVSLAFMITPFFNKAKSVTMVASLLYMSQVFLYLVISETRSPNSYDSSMDPRLLWIMCLSSPVAFAAFL